MHAFLKDGIAAYADRHDLLAGGTSELSPYLHFGCVSRARAGAAGTRGRPRQRAGRVRPPAAWRDFYAHVLLNHPGERPPRAPGGMDDLEWEDDDEGFAAWCEGRTGFPWSTPACASCAPAAGCTTAPA